MVEVVVCPSPKFQYHVVGFEASGVMDDVNVITLSAQGLPEAVMVSTGVVPAPTFINLVVSPTHPLSAVI